MSAGRNDPCPCGSGRKYKHCCLGRQADPRVAEGPVHGRGTIRLTPEMRDIASRETAWQAEAVPLQIGFDDDHGARPVGLLVTAAGFVVHAGVRRRVAGDPGAVAAALERALAVSARELGGWPATVQVRHAEVAAALDPLLRPRDGRAVAVERLPELAEAARSMMDGIAGDVYWPPVCRTETWAAWDLPRSLVAEVFAAAADFWRAAPWRAISNLQAPRLVTGSGREWTACVLGNAGEEFGLALYSDADDLFERMPADGADGPFGRVLGRIVAVSFTPAREVSAAARHEARLARWQVAHPDAMPELMTVNTPGGGVTAADGRDLIVALRALPPFVETHRLALLREERTGTPCTAIEWEDGTTGARLRYAGEAVAAAALDQEDLVGMLNLDDMLKQAIAEAGEGADESEITAVAQRMMRTIAGQWNDSPQEEFGGLSPNQVQRLLAQQDWLEGDGPVQLRRDLPLAQLGGADTLFNMRTLLAYAGELGGLGATQAGNLKLVVVAELLERFRFPEGTLAQLRSVTKRITEQDVRNLHEARVIAELGGLLHRRGPRFELTRPGEELLGDEAAGELYAHLFNTCFREFNVGYLMPGEWSELQTQAAYTLFRLQEVAREWRTAEDLLPEVVLPHALERAPTNPYVNLPTLLLDGRLLRRLVGLGLLEWRGSPRYGPDEEPVRYRLSPLFGKFLTFAE